jgi:alanyl aminopeptidase
MPNAEATGYYHTALAPEALDRLWKGGGKELSLVERIRVADDLHALMKNGTLPVESALSRLPDMAKDPSPQMLRSAADLLFAVRDSFVPAALRPNFARFVQKALGPRARAVGWKPKAGEDEQIRLVRPLLLSIVADKGEDKALRAEARELASRWLDDPRAIDGDIVDAALAVTARQGDKALFDRLHEAARKTKDQNQRRHLMRAMAGFLDPAIVKQSLALLLSDEFDVRDSLTLLFLDRRVSDVGFGFVKQNFDTLVSRLPDEIHGNLPYIGSSFCDEAHRADVEAFFKDRIGKLNGGPRNLAQVLEGISLCSAQREAQAPSLTTLLKKY